MSNTALLKCFLQHPFQVGACWPSSPSLCRMIVSGIDIESSRVIVELGPGTGVITREILEHLSENAHFLAIELDSQLFNQLRDNFPGVDFCNDSASALRNILNERGLPTVDTVISGLPWAIFPESLQKEILQTVCSALSEDGWFVTFAYLQGLMLPAGVRFRKLLKETFGEVRVSRIVWRNLPPAFVYRCRL